ncbi:MAG: hypothetical protein ACP5N1_06425 [Candidatus Woesearchaeota archaeon]
MESKSDKQNLDLLLTKICEQYDGKLVPDSGKLTSFDLGEKSQELAISIPKYFWKYDILIPGIDGDLFFGTDPKSLIDKYIQTNEGIIIRKELKKLISFETKPYIPPNKVDICIYMSE